MDLSDIQGVVFHSYRSLPYASYVLLRFGQRPAAARRWLADFVEHQRIDCAVPKEIGPMGSPEIRLNIALTINGLRRLDVAEETLDTFPVEFGEGLGARWERPDTPDHRSRMLGDVEESEPAAWRWGYDDDDRRVDALLLAYARDPVSLESQLEAWIGQGTMTGALAGSLTLTGRMPDDPTEPNREPFGFVDGISQPTLEGATALLRRRASAHQPALQEIADGEILLGHRDNASQIAASPTVDSDLDPRGILPPASGETGRHDLGFNGTYLVFRQLTQHVEAFQDACRHAAAHMGLTEDHAAALVVGRWKNGSPLISAPIEHDPSLAFAPAANDFSYRHDPHGERCPMGAHIRRANPRDSLAPDPEASLRIVSRHRIIRRGRRYFSCGERGLHFICLNASISRQFEFIQQNWINDPTFGGLSSEDDPLIGARQQDPAAGGNYTMSPPPNSRVPHRMSGLRRFVTVRGGAYFFLPSLTALRYLATADRARARDPQRALAPAPVSLTDRFRAVTLTRFSLLSVAFLVLAPLGTVSAAKPIAGPTFDLDAPWEMLVVAAFASLAAAAALLTFRITRLYAPARFGVRTTAPPLTWRTVFSWQLSSLPIVLTALWRSASDAAGVAGSSRTVLWFVAAAIGGYALAFALLYIAAAVRAAGVRADNGESSMLIPATRGLDRLRRGSSFITRLAAPIVAFAESRAARGAGTSAIGYVGPDGRLLPGHLTSLAFMGVLAFMYLVGFRYLKPSGPLQLPPLAYVLFVAIAVGLATAGAAFFLDRYRVPVLAVIVAWLAIATLVGGSDHEFDVLAAELSPAPSVDEIVAAGDRVHARPGLPDAGRRPIVVVAAAGGGIRQAAWTTEVLVGLTTLWGTSFSENLRLVSAVSAGGLGTLHYLSQYTKDDAPSGDLQPVIDAAEASASGDIWWGLAYPDAFRALLSFSPKPFVGRTMDRGWALERGWQRTLGPVDKAPTLNDWRHDAAEGWRPAVAFNATIVETGQRAALASYHLPGTAAADAGRITGGKDLPLVTAVRLSAAFPYVTPVARPSNGSDARSGSMSHLADGGYWDNSGMVTAGEWLRKAGDLLRGRNVLVIRIAPAVIGDPAIRDRAWAWQLTAPLSALTSARTGAQGDRTALDVASLQAWLPNSHVEVATIHDTGSDATLGWHLSRSERADINCRWRRFVYDTPSELDKITAILGPRSADLPERCAP